MATGVALAIVTGLVVYGGTKRIAHVAEFIVPIVAVVAISASLC